MAANTQPAGLYPLAQALQKTTLSRSSFYRAVKNGEIEAPVHLTGRRVAWRGEAIDAWVASRPSVLSGKGVAA